jgi:hypothetical protein
MKTVIRNRADRLGANFLSRISQFVYAISQNYSIEYDHARLMYPESMFTQVFLKIIENYKAETNEFVETFTTNLEYMCMRSVLAVEMDLITYFERNFKKDFFNLLKIEADKRGYALPENWDNTTCIHLRLDDVCHNGAFDYDGKYSENFFVGKINSKNPNFSQEEYNNFMNSSGVYHENLNIYRAAAPISDYKYLDLIEKHNITGDIKIVASPNGQITLPFERKISDNTDYDLWLMMNCKNLVLSKSTFSIIAGFLFQGEKVYCPNWGHFASMGLGSIYDKTNYIYFY